MVGFFGGLAGIGIGIAGLVVLAAPLAAVAGVAVLILSLD